MKKVFTVLAASLVMLLTAAGQAKAGMIDFEDISSQFVPSGYQGFTWGGGATDWSWAVSDELENNFLGDNAHSGSKYAWSNAGTDLSLSDGNFTFESLWARIGNLTAGTAIARGFDSSNAEIYTATLNLTDDYQLFNLNFVDITRWELTNQDNNVLIDDISLNVAPTVPEPTSMTLWGIGILGMATIRTRRRNS